MKWLKDKCIAIGTSYDISWPMNQEQRTKKLAHVLYSYNGLINAWIIYKAVNKTSVIYLVLKEFITLYWCRC